MGDLKKEFQCTNSGVDAFYMISPCNCVTDFGFSCLCTIMQNSSISLIVLQDYMLYYFLFCYYDFMFLTDFST